VPAPTLPPEYEDSRDATPEELASLPTITRTNVHTLESCIAKHHVADVEYTDAEHRHSQIRLRPAFIRYNKAHHIVVWGFPVSADHWIELRLDRIGRVRDTGKAFEPAW
jgi:WYL domain-containing protein